MLNEINVLIIEDDLAWQKIISQVLQEAGFNVAAIAKNLDDALLLIDNIQFDIALVDIFIGDYSSGLTLGKVIRNKYNKPFIFVTGTVDNEILEFALISNPSCYLPKSFTKESLVINIRNSIHQHNLLIELTKSVQPDSSDTFFFAKSGKQLKRIEWRDVICLQSDKNYTRIITYTDDMYMIRCSLQNALSHIIPINIRQNFIQINRGEAIQISHINKLIHNTVIINNKEYEISERYVKAFKLKLNIIN